MCPERPRYQTLSHNITIFFFGRYLAQSKVHRTHSKSYLDHVVNRPVEFKPLAAVQVALVSSCTHAPTAGASVTNSCHVNYDKWLQTTEEELLRGILEDIVNELDNAYRVILHVGAM